jgi:D-3-phosphoglycerate dehydrogenase
MAKILISDPIADKGIEVLDEAGFDVIYNPNPTNDELHTLARDIDGWVVRSGTKITSELLKDSRRLKVIGRAGVGVDNIDIKQATSQGVIVMNNPDGNTISAAEHTMAMMMALSRNIQLGHMGISKGEWNRSNLVGNELKGKTLGVVGLGRIGREVIKRALGMDMKIIGYDPFVNQEVFDAEKVIIVNLDILCSDSDYITLHLPLLDSTKYLFDGKRLSTMKPTARIINVARGGIINEEDLAYSLNNSIISGAAVDVFESEPLDLDSPLISATNILLTPHLGASTHEASEGVSFGICQQMKDFILEGKLSNPINMPIRDMAKLKKIKPHLSLSEMLGKIQTQLVDSPIKSISVECFGNVEDSKPIALSFLIGVFHDMTDNRINFVNAAVIAKERGISLTHSLNSKPVSYSNLIVAHVVTENGTIEVAGSIFDDHHPRIVDIMGYEVDFRPEGNMLFVQNKDVPGVIGKVGMMLGEGKVNIAEYLLSRADDSDFAYSVIKVDGQIENKLLDKLSKIDEILDIKQLYV